MILKVAYFSCFLFFIASFWANLAAGCLKQINSFGLSKLLSFIFNSNKTLDKLKYIISGNFRFFNLF